ncbi:MAG TPA: SRPBCC family protein [Acetobacteraceae bacterium]|jgi:hypothetical protein|nr:SRPBCC family protein [Acetobacteraceae bacterium]
MARSYYSTVIDIASDLAWAAIRDFGHYGWAGVVSETHIEDGRSGDAVGCIRDVSLSDRTIRQILLAHSDRDRSYTYAFCDASPFPVHDYVATIRITPVADGNRSFVEWWATFDCAADDRARWVAFFADSFRQWLEALRCHLAATTGAGH